MEKPEVLVGSLEEEFQKWIVDTFDTSSVLPRVIEERITQFRLKLEEEAWQAFEIAQAFSTNQERIQLEEDKARYRERVDAFNVTVRAFRKHVQSHNEKHSENEVLPEEENPENV